MRIKVCDNKALLNDIKEYLAKRWLTNCFLSEDAILHKVLQLRIEKQEFEGGCYLFCNEDNYENLFYFLDEKSSPLTVYNNGLPIVLPLVYMEGKKRIPSEQTWINIGFKPYLERKRLFLLNKDISYKSDNIFISNLNYIDEIYAMMTESFEPFSSALLSKDELKKEIICGNILVFLNDNDLLGFLHFETVKNVSNLWHIAVKNVARGKGIGDRLVRYWIKHQNGYAKRYTLWVRNDNMAALRMYEKIGFQPDGRVAPIMIKREDD